MLYELKQALWNVFDAIRAVSVFKNTNEKSAEFTNETIDELEKAARGLTCMIIETAEALPLKKDGEQK